MRLITRGEEEQEPQQRLATVREQEPQLRLATGDSGVQDDRHVLLQEELAGFLLLRVSGI